MLRRLLIAVFVIGLIVAFNGAAFADVIPNDGKKARQTPVSNNSAKEIKLTAQPQNFQRAADDAEGPVNVTLSGSPNVASPDTSACYDQDWTDYGGTAFFYTWTRPAGDTRELAMRMSIPAGHTAEVYGSYVYMNVLDAASELTVTMYGDAGGIPDDGDIIHTEVVSGIPIDSAGGYYYIAYTGGPIVLSDRSDFHVGVKCTAGGKLRFWSDDGGDPTNAGTATGTERSSYRSAGTWIDVLTLFGDGTDVNFIITATMCQYFSDCYTLNGLESTPGAGTVGLWIVPDPAWGSGEILNGMAQRFTVANDTLVQIRARFWRGATFFGPLGLYDSTSTNGLEVNVWADDGTGNIDYAAGPLATRTVPGGLANMFPASGNLVGGTESFYFNMLPDNLLLRGPYHLSMEMTSSNDADGMVLFALNSTSTNAPAEGASVQFIGAAQLWQRTGESPTWLTESTGQEQAFLIYPTFCRDEFQDCQNQILWGVQPYWVWTMFDGSNNNMFAQLVKGNPVNRLEKVRIQIGDEYFYTGDPLDIGVNGTPQLQLNVWSDPGLGIPGSLIYSQVITTPVYWPGWNEVVIPGGLQILGSFYIGYEGIFPDPVNDYFYAITDDDAQAPINGGALIYRLDFGPAWVDLDVDFGYVDNIMAEAEFCSIPVDEYVCVPGTDWVTLQHDYARTGHSGNAMSDAYCDLTLVWSYAHPSKTSQFAGPIVKDGKLVQAFDSEYIVFNLADGTILNTLGPFGTGIFCIPTIADVTWMGNPIEALFLAGGSDGRVRMYDWNNLAGGALWTYAVPGSGRSIRWGNFIVLNDGTNDVLFFAEDVSRIHAVNVQTGTAYAGWPGFFNIIGFSPTTSRNGATNGVDALYYASNAAGFQGDLYSFDAFTRAINWQLSATAGLQGATEYGVGTSDEGFDGGILYEAPFGSEPAKLYVNSSMTGSNPIDGLFYILGANDGSLIAYERSNRMRYATPMLDAQQVYVPTFTRWVNPPAGGDLVAFSKADASVSWAYAANVAGGYSRYYNEGFVTCEPDGAPDQVYAMNESGFISCINAADGDEIFTRRIDYLQGNPGLSAANIGGAGAIIPDTMVFSHYFGGVSVLAKSGVNRPRLEVQTWRQQQAVPFGVDVAFPVTFPGIFTNTGCADLTYTLVADVAQNGTTPGKIAMVGGGRAEAAQRIADMLAENGFLQQKYTQPYKVDEIAGTPIDRSASRVSQSAALAAPPYLNTTVINGILAPGDTADIDVTVNQTLLSRGQFTFYMEIQSDDPDYFINTGALAYPDVRLTLLSGCVIDTTTLYFGAGGANHQLVTNTSRLGTGDWTPGSGGPGNFSIDGDDASYYQGAMGYGVSQYRIAMNSQDWTTYAVGSAKDDEEGAFVSMQADPNYVNGDCKPAIATSVAVPDYTLDGVTYSPLNATAVYSSFLDSVQIFEQGGVWDWSLVADLNYDSPFDNDSTMGLYVNSRTIGITDAPVGQNLELLNQFTTQVMEITERNGGTVSDWAMFAFHDYDIGADTVQMNVPASAGWTWDKGGNPQVWGMAVIPYGPGYTGMWNTIGIVGESGAQGFWNYGTYWDSSYFYCANYPQGAIPLTDDGNMTTEGDGEAHHSLYRGMSWGPNETKTIGVLHWSMSLATPGSASAPEVKAMTSIANKFAGFGRGDMNNDNDTDLGDLIQLANFLFHGGNGPIPFAHLSDVNADGVTNLTDVNYMVDYYFNYGPAPVGDWEI